MKRALSWLWMGVAVSCFAPACRGPIEGDPGARSASEHDRAPPASSAPPGPSEGDRVAPVSTVSQRGAPEGERAAPVSMVSLDTSCAEDGDCVAAPSCCPTPCTSSVINVRDLSRAQKRLGDCPKGEPCPTAGGCPTHAYLCVANRCSLVFEGQKAYRAR